MVGGQARFGVAPRVGATLAALAQLEKVLSSINEDRRDLGAEARVELMCRARKLVQRMGALADMLTAEVDAANAAMQATGTPTTTLIAQNEKTSMKAATGEVFRARDVSQSEQTRKAALDGRIGNAHAAAVGRCLKGLPGGVTAVQRERIEQRLLAEARTLRADQLEEAAKKALQEIAPEHAETVVDEVERMRRQRKRALEDRYFAHGRDGKGSVWFKGQLPELEAEPLIALVQQRVAAVKRGQRDGARPSGPAFSVYRAQQRTTNAQHQADALAWIATTHADGSESGGTPRRPLVTITMTEADLRDRAEGIGVLDSGAKVTGGELRRMCCDAALLPVVLGSHSEPLDVGRAQRLVTPGIRRSLVVRDGGCAFPQCTVPASECEAHHIRPWQHGGSTSLGNLVLLCKHHHSLVEPDPGRCDQWSVAIPTETGTPVFTPPRRTMRYTRDDEDDDGPATAEPTIPQPVLVE